MTTLHIIPNAHLDPVWLWDAREGLDQGIRTIRSVLDLMDEFPELTFVRGEAAIYRHLEETDPAAFARVLARVREGRWDVVGGTWIQPDTNLAGAFTLRRQYETGLAYFTSRLGVRPRVAWQADAFGHTAGLPDIMAAAGMESFAFWRPQQDLMPLPKPAFWWRGPSGARILCYRLEPGWYGTNRDEARRRLDDVLEFASRSGLDNAAVFLGLGDHGGGPSRRQILDVRAWAAEHPDVRVEWSGLHRFFDALRAEAAAKGGDAFFPEVSGELNFTLRGCYTSCLRIKSAFRHAEAELEVAERAIALVSHAEGAELESHAEFAESAEFSVPVGRDLRARRVPHAEGTELESHAESAELESHAEFAESAEFCFTGAEGADLQAHSADLQAHSADLQARSADLLFNSFHDILPGSCMERAVEEQLQQLGGVRDAARKALHAVLCTLASAADTSVPKPRGDFPAALPFVVFNPHPWNYRGPLELEGCIDDRPDYFKPYGGGQAPLVVRDPRGRRIPFQIIPAETQVGDVVWRSRVVFDARIPAHGFAVYTLGWDAGGKGELFTKDNSHNCSQVTNPNPDNPDNPVKKLRASASPHEIHLGDFSVSARIGASGVRILRGGKPWLKGAGLQALLFRDAKGSWGDNGPRQYDESVPPVAWRVESAEVLECGPLRAALWVRLAGERSWLELVLRVAACRDAIDCEARLLWNERAARLKLALPCGAVAADCAVPGAVVRRPAALGEVPFVPWALAVDRAGAPVLGFASDALSGLDMERGVLRPSVIRASGYAWAPRDGKPMEPWRPATDLGEHRFRFLLAPGSADMPRLAAELLQPPSVTLAHVSSPGPLGRSGSLASRSCP